MKVVYKNKVLYPEFSYKINGILFKVKKDLGHCKNEKQYCDAIEKELKRAELEYEREKILEPSFENEKRGRNKVDFLIEEKIILEVKAKPYITKPDYYQVRRYLEALGKKLAIIVNMRRYYINPKRVLNSKVKE